MPDIPRSDAAASTYLPPGVVAPQRISIPQLGIDMPIEAEGVDDNGAMALPPEAAIAGWYQYGPGIHNDEGATVIAAHIDSFHDGVGPFSRLRDASAGSTVTVSGSDGSSVDYTITEVRSVGKIDAPMAEVFDRSGDPRLTLVTCGGIFDSSTGHYLDNVIVTAVPASSAGG